MGGSGWARFQHKEGSDGGSAHSSSTNIVFQFQHDNSDQEPGWLPRAKFAKLPHDSTTKIKKKAGPPCLGGDHSTDGIGVQLDLHGDSRDHSSPVSKTTMRREMLVGSLGNDSVARLAVRTRRARAHLRSLPARDRHHGLLELEERSMRREAS